MLALLQGRSPNLRLVQGTPGASQGEPPLVGTPWLRKPQERGENIRVPLGKSSLASVFVFLKRLTCPLPLLEGRG